MILPVFFFLALALALVSYILGQGGPVAGLVFFGVFFTGIVIKVLEPLLHKAKPLLPERFRP
ncbi:MAG: hypothetical protein ACO3CR_06750 [Solirubrobacterales bacterium]